MAPHLYDTHAHVHFDAFKNDAEEVMRRALDAGVWCNLVGTQRNTSARGVEWAHKFSEGVYAAVGLHPNHVTEQPIDEEESHFISRGEKFDFAFYKKLAEDPKVVGIGECGLDYFHLPPNMPFEEVRALQINVFEKHCDIATEAEKALIVHCRDAQHDVLPILERYVAAGKLPARGVAHCFDGTSAEAERYLAMGFYLSFTGIITFPPRKNNPEHTLELHRVIKETALEKLLVETDCPYLAPLPHRGKRNEPLYVEFTAQKIAELKGIPFEEVARATTHNARNLFKI